MPDEGGEETQKPEQPELSSSDEGHTPLEQPNPSGSDGGPRPGEQPPASDAEGAGARAEQPPASGPGDKPSGLSSLASGTVAGVVAFVAGGVGTIVAAIGDFGSDTSGLAAARRNHVLLIVAAAAAAAFGLACGALYAILKPSDPPKNGTQAAEPTAPVIARVSVGKGVLLVGIALLGAGVALLVFSQVALGVAAVYVGVLSIAFSLISWNSRVNLTQARGATAILVLGALAVAAGVAMGAIATSAREPGRPTIDVKRLDDKTILIEVQGDGLPSYDWYEASATGYTDSSHTSPAVDLVSARFSPGQDGKLDWKQRVDAQSPDGKVKVGWVLVRVRHNLASTNPTDISCVEKDATCLAIAVPVTPEAAGR